MDASRLIIARHRQQLAALALAVGADPAVDSEAVVIERAREAGRQRDELAALLWLLLNEAHPDLDEGDPWCAIDSDFGRRLVERIESAMAEGSAGDGSARLSQQVGKIRSEIGET
jgi:hypothetical protein